MDPGFTPANRPWLFIIISSGLKHSCNTPGLPKCHQGSKSEVPSSPRRVLGRARFAYYKDRQWLLQPIPLKALIESIQVPSDNEPLCQPCFYLNRNICKNLDGQIKRRWKSATKAQPDVLESMPFGDLRILINCQFPKRPLPNPNSDQRLLAPDYHSAASRLLALSNKLSKMWYIGRPRRYVRAGGRNPRDRKISTSVNSRAIT
jgi:hypothetical protein